MLKHNFQWVTLKGSWLLLVRIDGIPLQWRHNERDGVSIHRPHDCLLKHLFRGRSKKTSKLRVTGLCEGNSLVIGEFPAQRASNAENLSIWWRHHAVYIFFIKFISSYQWKQSTQPFTCTLFLLSKCHGTYNAEVNKTSLYCCTIRPVQYNKVPCTKKIIKISFKGTFEVIHRQKVHIQCTFTNLDQCRQFGSWHNVSTVALSWDTFYLKILFTIQIRWKFRFAVIQILTKQ